jgi:peptidyl-prolyl cis-trans isomerase C
MDTRVAVKVGSRALSVQELERRLASLAPSKFAQATAAGTASAVGASGNSATRKLVEEVVVPELLWEQHLGDRAPTGVERERALAFALERRIARSVSVTDEDIAKFYAENPRYFQRPESILVWRIVTQTEAEALEVLNTVRANSQSIESWSKLARERSLDAATKMRKGSLGFVTATGQTEVPQVQVNAAVFDAAKALADGELAAAPLRDGEHYSALWRRGSKPPSGQTLEQARAEIEQLLLQRRGREAFEQLQRELRQRHVSLYQPDVLESIQYGLPESTTTRRPLVPHPAASSPVPSSGPDGDR